jgi:molybdate transport system ATP-binding protein
MSSTDGTISVHFSGVLGSFKLEAAFETPARGITALFGPSGCGKTTILRCVAGLSRLPGRLVVGNEVWQDHASGRYLEPHERPVGYVFQEASLFAHLSVRGNLRYGLRRALKNGAMERFRFDEVVEQLGIGHLLDRSTGELSGGERQRVALGRAFLSQPRLFLMDEPLSALDRMTKEEILPYFEALRSSTSVPTLYVSHDITEIERLADHMVFLESGRLVAAGPLNDLLADTRLPIAQSPEAATVLDAHIGPYSAEDGLTALSVGGEKLLIPGKLGNVGDQDRVRIAATDVSLAIDHPSRTTILNIIPVRVKDIQPLDNAQINVLVAVGHQEEGQLLLARITRRAVHILGLAPGQQVYAQIKAVSLIGPAGRPTRSQLAERAPV